MSAMAIPLCVSFVYCVVFNLEMEAVPVVHFGNRHSFPADTHRQKTVPADNSDLGSSVEEQHGSADFLVGLWKQVLPGFDNQYHQGQVFLQHFLQDKPVHFQSVHNHLDDWTDLEYFLHFQDDWKLYIPSLKPVHLR